MSRDALSPAEFAASVTAVADRLPSLARAVDARPWVPKREGEVVVPSPPAERTPVYLAAVSLLDEIRREAFGHHSRLTLRMGTCRVVEDDSDDNAARWLYRLSAAYWAAHGRPRLAREVKEASSALSRWESRAAYVLGELLAPWALRNDRGKVVRCPAYPRQGPATRCGSPLSVVPSPEDATPQAIRCDSGHRWDSWREWQALGAQIAEVPIPAPSNVQRPSRQGYGGRP